MQESQDSALDTGRFQIELIHGVRQLARIAEWLVGSLPNLTLDSMVLFVAVKVQTFVGKGPFLGSLMHHFVPLGPWVMQFGRHLIYWLLRGDPSAASL